MLQYSVYEISNSENMLDKIEFNIVSKWEKLFGEEDSVMIIKTSKNCKIQRFGYEKHANDDIIIV
jgi:CRISPR/Cas system-associated endoribonuclease Cas2